MELLSLDDFRNSPRPGLYVGIPDEDYFALKAVSNSLLSEFQKSPAHAKHALETTSEQTRYFDVGTAYHRALLEPDLFDTQVDKAGQCSGTTKAENRCSKTGSTRIDGKWYCEWHNSQPDGEQDNVLVLKDRDYDHVIGMRKSAYAHPFVQTHLDIENGYTELVALWIDPVTNLQCKGKIDYLSADGSVVIDLKTTRDANMHSFARSLYTFGYYRQASHYMAGLRHSGVLPQDYYIVAAEKEAPYGLRIYQVPELVLHIGTRHLSRLKEQFAACHKSNSWPGYTTEVEAISLPDWAYESIEKQLGDAGDTLLDEIYRDLADDPSSLG